MIPIEIYHILLASLMGLIIGVERRIKHKVASIRTFAIISGSCCLFTILSQSHFPGLVTDPTRIASNILTGLGFLGGGVIYKYKDKIEGVTTAALLWYVSALGMACGFGRIDCALWGFFSYLVIWIIGAILHRIIN